MELLSPKALWGLLALAVLLLLPRLRLPRERLPVGSLHLWRQSPTDERPRPYVRLQRNLALLLQAAAIIFIVAALAQPVLRSHGRTIALILDTSASMGARDGNGTRMDTARQRARDLIAALPFGSRVRLFTAGADVRTEGDFGARSRELQGRLSALKPGEAGASIVPAVTAARATTDGEVVVISDAPAVRAADVRWIGVGAAAANVAITTFASRPLPGSPFDTQLLAEVRNYSAQGARCSLTIARPSGAVDRQQLDLAPGASRVVVFEMVHEPGEYVARIDADDSLAADNVRTLVLDDAQVGVAVEGTVSAFVRSALDANPRIRPVPADAADVLLCGAGCDPSSAAAPAVIWMPGGAPASAPLRIVDRRHALSPLVGAGPFTATASRPVPADASIIARTGTDAAVAAWQHGTRRTLLLALRDDDVRVVYETAFPLLIAGAVDWASARPSGGVERGIPVEESDLRAAAQPVASESAAAAASNRTDGTAAALSLVSLCLLLAVAAMVVEWRISRPAPGRAAIGMRAIAVVMLVLAAAGLSVPTGEGPASVVFAIDRSQSVSGSAQATAMESIARITERMRGADAAAVVAFGADAVVDQPLATRAPASSLTSDVARGGTNIEAAIGVARALLPRDGARRIVLLSDGNATSGDALREARSAVAEGVAIDVVPLSTRRDGSARVTAVTAPDRVAASETFEVTATIAGPPSKQTAVTLLRDGTPALRQVVTFDNTGLASVTMPERIAASGIVTYTATSGDQDTAGAGVAVAVEGSTSVLYVSDQPRRIAAGGFRVEQRSPALIPSSAGALARFGAVVLDDVAAASLSSAAAAAIAEYVTGHGGGLILRGSERTLGPSGYPQTALDAILPVDFRGRAGSRAESMALVVAFDKSGSMADRAGDVSKIELARRSVLAVHDVLTAGDSLGVIAFDAHPSPATALEPKGDAAALRERLRTINPGGPTRMAPAMRMARAWLDQTQAKRRAVLLISDGRSDAADAAEVLALFRDKSVTLTIVAAGDDSDRSFFRQLAAGAGAQVYAPDTLAALPSIAAREAVRATGGWRVNEPTQPRIPAAHPITTGIDVASLPLLRGYIAAARRDDAESVIESHLGDPLLATRRAGLGRVAVLTANDEAASHTGAWSRAAAQAVRWAAHDSAEDRFGVTLTDDGGAMALQIDAVTPSGTFINGLTGTAVIRTASGEDVSLELRQTAPGRYAARFEPQTTGTHLVSVALRDADGAEEFSTLRAIYWSSPAENAAADLDLPALAAIARTTGGRLLDATASPYDAARPRAFRDLSRWLAAIALILFIVELAARRGLSPAAFRRRIRLEAAA